MTSFSGVALDLDMHHQTTAAVEITELSRALAGPRIISFFWPDAAVSPNAIAVPINVPNRLPNMIHGHLSHHTSNHNAEQHGGGGSMMHIEVAGDPKA